MEVVEPKVRPEGVIFPLFIHIRVIPMITPLVRQLADTPLKGRVVGSPPFSVSPHIPSKMGSKVPSFTKEGT